MIVTVDIKLNLKTREVNSRVAEALRQTLRDVVVEVARDAIHESPVDTGNNRRSIFFGATGFPHKQASPAGRKEKDTWTGADESVLDESKFQAVVYSTSGYGGFLETGTSKMSARPYMKPAADRYFTEANVGTKMKERILASG